MEHDNRFSGRVMPNNQKLQTHHGVSTSKHGEKGIWPCQKGTPEEFVRRAQARTSPNGASPNPVRRLAVGESVMKP